MLTAESNYTTSRSTYRQVIGVEPGTLAPAARSTGFRRSRCRSAIVEARARHPSVTTAMFNVDAALFQVKIAEGALYPTLNLVGSAQKNYGSTTSLTTLRELRGVGGRPVHGADLSGRRRIRDHPPGQGDARPAAHRPRHRARPGAADAGAVLGPARSRQGPDPGDQAQVTAAEIALNGVREEARVGQRTTLDVLNAQQELVNARVALVTAQRDRVVASYALLAASGRLSPQVLGLGVPIYDPMVHYHQVRDTWVGRAHARRQIIALCPCAAVAARLCAYPQGRVGVRGTPCHTCDDPGRYRVSGVIRRAASGFNRRRAGVGRGNSAMSQPAKAQEPSMEEILASIRRIIADDDTAKPAARRAPAAPLPASRRHAAAQSGAAVAARQPPSPPPPAAMDQHDVDAMLAGVDAPPDGAEPAADDVLDLTEQMAASEAEAPSFQTIDGQSDVFFADAPAQPEPPPRTVEEPPEQPPPPGAVHSPRRSDRADRPLMSSHHVGGGRFRLQLAGADRAGAERPHARRSGARDAAADAEVLARRQSAGHGRAHRAGRDRARLARPQS